MGEKEYADSSSPCVEEGGGPGQGGEQSRSHSAETLRAGFATAEIGPALAEAQRLRFGWKEPMDSPAGCAALPAPVWRLPEVSWPRKHAFSPSNSLQLAPLYLPT